MAVYTVVIDQHLLFYVETDDPVTALAAATKAWHEDGYKGPFARAEVVRKSDHSILRPLRPSDEPYVSCRKEVNP